MQKRCYNIDNISAGTLDDPNYTRITIVSTGDEYMKDQVVRQLEKLDRCPRGNPFGAGEHRFAQHMYIKMHLTGTHRGSSKHQVLDLINEYGGKVVDFGEEHLTAEITGDSKKLNLLLKKSEILVY